MRLPEIGVKRPVFTLMLFFAIFILGVVSFIFIPIDLLPEIEPPKVSVITPYVGVGAEDIETLVTKPIENVLNSVENVDEITSISKDSLSIVTLNFTWGADLSEAMDNVRLQLEFIRRDLPVDIEPPQIFKFGTTQFPVGVFGITAGKHWEELRNIAEKKIQDRIKTMPGVGSVRLIAGVKRQITIDVHMDRLRAFPNISLMQIGKALAAENLTVPVGDLTIGRNILSVRLPMEFEDPSELEDIVIGATDEGRTVKIKDVADVTDTFEEQGERVFFNKHPAILFLIFKQSGGNTVQVMKSVHKKLNEIQQTLPEDIKIVRMFDTSEFIGQSISNLQYTILFGGALVIIVVFLFLRKVRSSLVIALTIPFSLILAFIFLYFFDYTINMMSLMSLAVAIGMVVDTAIVILENITRHLEEGAPLNRACVEGASEVGLAVSASALTTIVIFVPLLFVTGFVGVMFRQLGFVIAVTLMGSLFAGLMLTPMLVSKLMKKDTESGFSTASGKLGLYGRAENLYLSLLDRALRHRAAALVVAFLAFIILTAGLILNTSFEFMPQEDTGDLRLFVELAPGTDVDVTTRVGLHISQIMMDNLRGAHGEREWKNLFLRTGQSRTGFATAVGEKEGNNILTGGGRLTRRKTRTRSSFEYADILRPLIRNIPEVVKIDIQAGNMMQQFFGESNKPLVIEIKGADIKATNNYAHILSKKLEKLKGLSDIAVSRDAGKINLSLKMDRDRISAMGLNTAMVAAQLRTAIFGSTVTKYRQGENEYDIIVQIRESDRKTIEQLKNVPVLNMMGKQVTLGNIADIEESVTPIQVDRLDQERVITVQANTKKGADLNVLKKAIHKIISEEKKPAGTTAHIGGAMELMADTFKDLFMVAILGLVLVYMVMASQFENLVDPFIVMFSIPFALVGVFLFILLTGISFNMYTFLGIIMLMGIVVNNAIVYVDYANILRKRGMALNEALRQAGKHRLRPILMTTLTTIFGMLPMALNRAEGAEFYRPLGISVIGGLFVSGLVTLVLIPTIYHIVYSGLEKIGRGKREEIVI